MEGGAIEEEEEAWKGLREATEEGVADRGVVKAEEDLKESFSALMAASSP